MKKVVAREWRMDSESGQLRVVRGTRVKQPPSRILGALGASLMREQAWEVCGGVPSSWTTPYTCRAWGEMLP